MFVQNIVCYVIKIQPNYEKTHCISTLAVCVYFFRISYLSDGTTFIWKKKWNHKRLMIEIGSMVSYRGLGGRIDGTNKWLMLRRHKTPPQLQQTEQALLIRGSFSNLTRSTVNKNCYSIHALTGSLVKKKIIQLLHIHFQTSMYRT